MGSCLLYTRCGQQQVGDHLAGRGNSEIIFAQKFNFTQDYNGNVDGNRWLVMLGLRKTNYSPYGRGWGACTVNPKLVGSFNAKDARRMASVIDAENEGVATALDPPPTRIHRLLQQEVHPDVFARWHHGRNWFGKWRF